MGLGGKKDEGPSRMCGSAMEEMGVAGSAAGLQRAHNAIVTQEVVSSHWPLM